MSIEVMNRVWTHSNQKGANLLLLLAIADNANASGEAWPGIEYLARKTRMSVRQTQRLIQSLARTDELAVEWRGSGRGDSHMYHVLVGKSPEKISAIQDRVELANTRRARQIEKKRLGDNLTSIPEMQSEDLDDNLSPKVEDPMGDKSAEKGVISNEKGDKFDGKDDSATSPEPLTVLENPEEEPREGNQPQRARNDPPPTIPSRGSTKGETVKSPEIQLFFQVTGRYPRKDQFQIVIEAIRKTGFTVAYLQPFWNAWVARDYKRTNLDWMLDWATKGEIPGAGSSQNRRPSARNEPKGYQGIRDYIQKRGLNENGE